LASATGSLGHIPNRLPRYGRMAVFSVSGSPESRRSAGTRPCGLILRYASVRCSPLARSTGVGSYFSPLSSSTMCAAIEHAPGAKYSVNMNVPPGNLCLISDEA